VKAVIMAGGFGTRLRPLTVDLPKPMMPMVNRPIMEHIVTLLARHGITDLVCLLYFQGEKISDYFGNGDRFGVSLTYVTASDDFGTAGAVKNAQQHLGEPFVVISGDLLTDFDLTALWDFHRQKGARATVTLTRVADPLSYGIVIVDEGGRICRFLEKPTWGEVFSDTINTGIYVLQPEVLDLIPERTNFDFSRDLFPKMLAGQEPLFGYVARGYWRDIGDLNEYHRSHVDILEGVVKVDIPGKLEKKDGAAVWVDEEVTIGPRAQLGGTVVLGRGCRVADGASLSDCVIGQGGTIKEEASVSRSVLWDHVTVGHKASLTEAVVGSGTVIEQEAYVMENAIISHGCTIGRESHIKANVKIWPGKVVDRGALLSSSLVWGKKWESALFSEAKVSGLANWELTPEFAAKLGAALGAYLGKGSYAITSRDADRSSRMIKESFNGGLLSAGVNVLDLRAMPIPVVRYELKSGRETGGVHVRRSPYHHDQQDVIFFDAGGMDLPPSKTKAVERLFFREDFYRATPQETGVLDFPYRVVESYHEGFLRAIDREAIARARFKVVVDYSSGAAATVFPSILGELGCEVVSLNAFLDHRFLTVTAESFQRSIDQLSAIVTSLKADAGFLLNAGAERLFVVGEDGKLIDNSHLVLLVTRLFLETGGVGSIGVPITASREIERMAAEKGSQVIRTRDDHGSMMAVASRPDVGFVGGTRGGFIFPEFQRGSDAMYAMAKILELMARQGTTPAQLIASCPRPLILSEVVPCPWDLKGQVMRRMMEHTEGRKRELVDGVRVLFEDSWVLVIPSVYEALFRVHAEAPTEKKAQALIREYVKLIKRWQKEK
jgi:mannose-1-phosphate guanylyltransferase/phosphomannomutase